MTNSDRKMLMSDEDIEIQLFLEALYLKYGYDFLDYSRAHIKRRILKRLMQEKFESINQMMCVLLKDKPLLEKVLSDFSINATQMFRDPSFFAKLRSDVLPMLDTYAQIRIWIAGCASGEEIYSLAILLKELGMYDKSIIYATDFNDKILSVAKEGIYPINIMKDYTKNYQLSGGTCSLSDYYLAKYSYAKVNNELKQNIVFANHNLVTDSSFSQMHLILCRNVMIYFNMALKNKAIRLFYDSLNSGCFLCLGMKENLQCTDFVNKFIALSDNERIYQKTLYPVAGGTINVF